LNGINQLACEGYRDLNRDVLHLSSVPIAGSVTRVLLKRLRHISQSSCSCFQLCEVNFEVLQQFYGTVLLRYRR
jgi:hypothetical protein